MCRPPTMLADCPAASDSGPAVSYTRRYTYTRGSPSRFDRCTMAPGLGAGDPAAARVSRAHSTRNVNRLSSGVRRGEAVIPLPVVRGPTATVLPRSRSPGRFGCATTRYVDHPQAAMGSRHRPGTAPGPVGDRPPFAPPPAIQLRSRR